MFCARENGRTLECIFVQDNPKFGIGLVRKGAAGKSPVESSES